MKTPDEHPHPDLTPHQLEDLPPHRQRNLLWHYTTPYSREEVAALMPGWTTRRCQHLPPWAPEASTVLLGDDGRYHLTDGEHLLCGNRPKRAKPEDPWKHEQHCTWWTDGSRYALQVPPDGEGRYRSFDHRWTVHTMGEPRPASDVPPSQRCPILIFGGWPTWAGRKGQKGDIRRRLIAEFGDRCAVCGGFGQFMDHDPFTGLIRGLLCRYCNTNVDQCPHVSRCAWADYLNDPPAWRLGLEYPGLGATYATTVKRAEARGWDVFEFAEVRKRRRRESSGEGALFDA